MRSVTTHCQRIDNNDNNKAFSSNLARVFPKPIRARNFGSRHILNTIASVTSCCPTQYFHLLTIKTVEEEVIILKQRTRKLIFI